MIHLSSSVHLTNTNINPVDSDTDKAIIAKSNLLETEDYSITGPTEDPNFPRENLATYATNERYRITTLADYTVIVFASEVTFSYFGITLNSLFASITLEYFDTGTSGFEEIDTFVALGAGMRCFDAVSTNTVRFKSSQPDVVNVALGDCLRMERRLYGGHSPIRLSNRTTKVPQVSESGQWLGTTIKKIDQATSFTWNHLTANFYRTQFQTVAIRARKYPFYISWRPETYPNEAAFVWVDDDIIPTNMGIRDYMTVTMNCRGYGMGDTIYVA